jgi:hypothetical protein
MRVSFSAPFWGRTSGAAGAAGIEGAWSPRELRHAFVSLMSDCGVPVEEIARLAGHTSTRTTEIVYRHQFRPVMEKALRPWTSSWTDSLTGAATRARAEKSAAFRCPSAGRSQLLGVAQPVH